mmetsp:Transcript_1371/g.3124  ORF Transcript_1371/g.3124 Transcript_1371/m.3124 type:complete len:218 (-) Transcript_1371:198-851(-)
MISLPANHRLYHQPCLLHQTLLLFHLLQLILPFLMHCKHGIFMPQMKILIPIIDFRMFFPNCRRFGIVQPQSSRSFTSSIIVITRVCYPNTGTVSRSLLQNSPHGGSHGKIPRILLLPLRDVLFPEEIGLVLGLFRRLVCTSAIAIPRTAAAPFVHPIHSPIARPPTAILPSHFFEFLPLPFQFDLILEFFRLGLFGLGFLFGEPYFFLVGEVGCVP